MPDRRCGGLAGVGGRALGMGDAAAGGHQVQRAGRDGDLRAQAVAVHDLALEQVGRGGEADMRVRADVDALADDEVGRAHLVPEDEGADHLPPRRGQGAADLEPAEVAGAGDDDGLDGVAGVLVAEARGRRRVASSWAFSWFGPAAGVARARSDEYPSRAGAGLFGQMPPPCAGARPFGQIPGGATARAGSDECPIGPTRWRRRGGRGSPDECAGPLDRKGRPRPWLGRHLLGSCRHDPHRRAGARFGQIRRPGLSGGGLRTVRTNPSPGHSTRPAGRSTRLAGGRGSWRRVAADRPPDAETARSGALRGSWSAFRAFGFPSRKRPSATAPGRKADQCTTFVPVFPAADRYGAVCAAPFAAFAGCRGMRG